MPDRAAPTDVLISAYTASRFGTAPEAAVLARITSGDLNIPIAGDAFDSLSAMEFCIAIELATGLEMTVADLETLHSLADVARWLDNRGVR